MSTAFPRPADLDPEIEWPPTEDELPCSDGVPMDTPRHRAQMNLLIETLELHWASRHDFFVGGDMFLYFSLDQIRGRDFRGPDFFVVLGVEERERKSWVVWQEGKGPDVIIELLSESTAAIDKGEKKQVYQDQLRVPEYFWYDPFSGELAGFRLRGPVYEPITPGSNGRLYSEPLDLLLAPWEGRFHGITAPWLRWYTRDGLLLPTTAEIAEEERRRADEERARAEQERTRAEQERARAEEALRRVAELERMLGRERGAADEPDVEPR
jgi:Uma2 family endonuclease